MERIRFQGNENEYEIIDIEEKSPLLKITFATTVDIENENLSSFELLTEGGAVCRTFTEYYTIYKDIDENNTVILSSDGETYEEPEEQPNDNESETDEELSDEKLALKLEKLKESKIKLSNTLLHIFLEDNPLLFTDEKYYSVTLEKQGILTSNLMAYQIELQQGIETPILEWNATGEQCVPWGYDELCKLAIAIKEYVKPYVAKQQEYEENIRLCETVDELNEIVIDYASL